MLVLFATMAFVLASALLVAARLAGESVTAWLIGAYVVAFAEIVVVSLALSVGHSFTRVTVLAATLAVFAVAALVRPAQMPTLRAPALAARDAFRDPVLAVMAAVSAGVLCYSVALALFSPPNDEDALSYHLVRAAFWAQQQAVGYIPGAADSRLDEFAPTSEIVAAFTMVASGAGTLRTATPVHGFSRFSHRGIRHRPPHRPRGARKPARRAPLLHRTRGRHAGEHRPQRCRRGIARGECGLLPPGHVACRPRSREPKHRAARRNKLTGILSLPGLALLALLARRQRPLMVLAAFGASAVAGCYWYAFNATQGRDPFGGIGGERVPFDPVAAVARVVRLSFAAFELPGAMEETSCSSSRRRSSWSSSDSSRPVPPRAPAPGVGRSGRDLAAPPRSPD